MDTARVSMLREVLSGTEWLEATRSFAGALHGSVTRSPRRPGGLLLIGTESYEPWHLAAHLDDEAAWCGLPELSPTLVRCRVPAKAPPHLSFGLSRIEAARRGETVLVVAPGQAGEGLLERLGDARRTGATVLAMGRGDSELCSLAHESLSVPEAECPGPLAAPEPESVELDLLQHLVSAAVGEEHPLAGRRARFRGRLSRIAERLISSPAVGW